MTEVCYEKIYIQYAQDVLNDKILSCKWIKLACRQFMDRFNRDDMYFDYATVDKRIRFVAKLKHSTGIFNNKSFILLPWQQWIFAAIFGWKWTDTNLRVTRKALICVPRKNGKTALASAISICISILDTDDGAPEIDFIANSSQQAQIALKQTQDFTLSIDPKQQVWKQYRSQLKMPHNKGIIQIMSSDTNTGDGRNPTFFCQDESHAAQDSRQWDVCISGQGMRREPLALNISTFGFYLHGYFLYDMVETCQDILMNLKDDEAQFSAIYTLDEGDDWRDEACWAKANPSLGHTITKDFYRDQVKSAVNNVSLEVGVKTKLFNIWCQAENVWLAQDELKKSMEKIDIDLYKDEIAYGGIDLSSVSDLCAVTAMMPPNESREKHPDKFVFITRLYVPYDTMYNSKNSIKYQQWYRQGFVSMTPGNVTDYSVILEDLLEWDSKIQIMDIAYDQYNSTQFVINGTEAGLMMSPYSQSLGNFNRPTKYFEMLLKQGKVVLDYNPAVLDCFANCELKFDHNDNCKPVKSGSMNQKIDATISIIESLGAYLDSPDTEAMATAI